MVNKEQRQSYKPPQVHFNKIASLRLNKIGVDFRCYSNIFKNAWNNTALTAVSRFV